MTTLDSDTNPNLIVSVGDLVADMIIEVPVLPIASGDFQVARKLALEPGGSANFLITASRLGMNVCALGTIGEDVWGNEVASILREEQIDLTSVQFEGTTTVALVLVGPNGSHAFIGMYGEGSKKSIDADSRNTIASAGAVFSSGYNLQDHRITQFTVEAMMYARKCEVLTFFDPGPAFSSIEPEVREEVLKSVDVLLLTQEELKDLNVTINALFQKRLDTVVVKCGSGGCIAYASDGETCKISGLSVEVTDTTAAGDSFDAGFVVGQLRGWPLEDVANFANCVGAAKVRKLGGGRNVPTKREVLEIIREFEIDIEF